MTIQPSVVIWTVICFAALYFILKYLLFDPVLKVMDKREKKIADSKKAKEDASAAAEEKRRTILSEREKERQKLIAENEKTAEKLHSEVRAKLEDAKTQRFAYVEEYRKKAEQEFDSEMKNTDTFTDDAAKLFLSRLFDN